MGSPARLLTLATNTPPKVSSPCNWHETMTPPSISPCPELEERLHFETLIADLSSKFINLPAGEVDREIEDAQRRDPGGFSQIRNPNPCN